MIFCNSIMIRMIEYYFRRSDASSCRLLQPPPLPPHRLPSSHGARGKRILRTRPPPPPLSPPLSCASQRSPDPSLPCASRTERSHQQRESQARPCAPCACAPSPPSRSPRTDLLPSPPSSSSHNPDRRRTLRRRNYSCHRHIRHRHRPCSRRRQYCTHYYQCCIYPRRRQCTGRYRHCCCNHHRCSRCWSTCSHPRRNRYRRNCNHLRHNRRRASRNRRRPAISVAFHPRCCSLLSVNPSIGIGIGIGSVPLSLGFGRNEGYIFMVLTLVGCTRFFSQHPQNHSSCLRALQRLHPSIGAGFQSCIMSSSESLSTTVVDSNGLSKIVDPESAPEKSSTCSLSVRVTPDIEKKYVHRVYDAIAPHFSSTRFAKWPKVAEFLNSLSPDSIILDAGCGNGKYLGFNPKCLFIGCDISPPLVEICSTRGHEVMVADAVNLPYRDNFGDAAISIAVLHHLSTESRRRKAIEELVRIVRKGGLVLVTVWAVEQEDQSLLTKWTPLFNKYDEEWVKPSSSPSQNSPASKLESILEVDEVCQDGNASKRGATQVGSLSSSTRQIAEPTLVSQTDTQQEYFVPWHLPYHRAEITGESSLALENGFAKKDDKKGAVVYNRYYHVFKEGELQRLASGIKDAVVVVDQFYDKSNWCLVLKKM